MNLAVVARGPMAVATDTTSRMAMGMAHRRVAMAASCGMDLGRRGVMMMMMMDIGRNRGRAEDQRRSGKSGGKSGRGRFGHHVIRRVCVPPGRDSGLATASIPWASDRANPR